MKNIQEKTKQEGITLIALIVTIIVLLILAGITINLVLGENGLIRKAQMASNIWANATSDEMLNMDMMANDIGKLGIKEEEKAPGVYNLKTGELITTWEDLITAGQHVQDYKDGKTTERPYESMDKYAIINQDGVLTELQYTDYELEELIWEDEDWKWKPFLEIVIPSSVKAIDSIVDENEIVKSIVIMGDIDYIYGIGHEGTLEEITINGNVGTIHERCNRRITNNSANKG